MDVEVRNLGSIHVVEGIFRNGSVGQWFIPRDKWQLIEWIALIVILGYVTCACNFGYVLVKPESSPIRKNARGTIEEVLEVFWADSIIEGV